MPAPQNITVRDAAKAAIESLPANSSWEDVFHTLYVRKKIEQGLDDANKGDLLTNNEVKSMLGTKK